MSKGYTISYFMNLLQNTSTRDLTTATQVYFAVSPRRGNNSEKRYALDTWLQGQTSAIVSGRGRFANFGKSPRARLLKALRVRKENGFV